MYLAELRNSLIRSRVAVSWTAKIRNEEIDRRLVEAGARRLTVRGEYPFHLPVVHQFQERSSDLRIALQHE